MPSVLLFSFPSPSLAYTPMVAIGDDGRALCHVAPNAPTRVFSLDTHGVHEVLQDVGVSNECTPIPSTLSVSFSYEARVNDAR